MRFGGERYEFITQPATNLRGMYDMVMDSQSVLGASLFAAPSATTTFMAIYQREVLTDKSGLVSERVALDGSMSLGSHLLLSGSSDFDLASNEWGKARAGATWLLGGLASLQGEVFR